MTDSTSPIATKWKLVPVEPDDAMQAAGATAIRFDTTVLNKIWTGNAVFRAMLAASPPAPAAPSIAEKCKADPNCVVALAMSGALSPEHAERVMREAFPDAPRWTSPPGVAATAQCPACAGHGFNDAKPARPCLSCQGTGVCVAAPAIKEDARLTHPLANCERACDLVGVCYADYFGGICKRNRAAIGAARLSPTPGDKA